MADRTSILLSHSGSNVLPCMPIFSCLLRHAYRQPQSIAIRDVRENIERTHSQLLQDVLKLRAKLQESLSHDTLDRLAREDDVYISLLAPGGYAYAVGFLSILAIGGAVVPLSNLIPVKEALYFVEKTNSVAVLSCSSSLTLSHDLQDQRNAIDTSFISIHIEKCLSSSIPAMIPVHTMVISSDRYLSDNAAGVVIFTSGTTGPPKGAVMRRAYTFDAALAVVDHFSLTRSDLMLHVLPMHHATGVGISFLPFLVAGACIEFRSGGFDERWTWERWREGIMNPKKHITFFSGVPTIYMRMKRYFEKYLSQLPNKLDYTRAAGQFRAALCGTSALPRPINDFWTQIMGKRIFQRYGATEFGAVFKVRLDDLNITEGSVGEKVPGIDIKIKSDSSGESHGNDVEEGELMVKSPHMFSKYLGSSTATEEAHDEEGYFKTGDIVRREGNYFFILGRSSLDILKSGGYKISALDIEREILSLPYVNEVIVVGVPDLEFGQRVGAILSLSSERAELDLNQLRADLRDRLVGYKLPTVLRVVNGDLPKTSNGKVLKKVLGPKYFHEEYKSDPLVQVWDKHIRRPQSKL